MKPVITSNIENELRSFLQQKDYSGTAVLVDENTQQACYPLIESSLSKATLLIIKSGEIHKNLDTCKVIWEGMTAKGMDRNSLLINLGGGVIGDMGGFCAATFKRGIDFINIPTTLLAQVDASVGGKLGIDFNGYKNHIGVFKTPEIVMLDDRFLETLPKKQLRSGYAEVIKHAIIASREHWHFLKNKSIDQLDFSQIIKHSVAIKEQIVKEDPLENGKRKILNFGHTVGHALESHYLDSPNHLLHGEAVAAGMICEAFIAQRLNLLDTGQLEEITEYIVSIFQKIQLQKADYDKILTLMTQDKKNKGNKILMALPEKIGSTVWDVEVSVSLIKSSLDYYYNC
ncbi:MAG: 3-dehydroquinate synthase [Fulvivirga sp.]|nr:3-dehydroquinate synthase [Fulvivirga sp.]